MLKRANKYDWPIAILQLAVVANHFGLVERDVLTLRSQPKGVDEQIWVGRVYGDRLVNGKWQMGLGGACGTLCRQSRRKWGQSCSGDCSVKKGGQTESARHAGAGEDRGIFQAVCSQTRRNNAPGLKPQIGHNIGFQAPISPKWAWVPSRAEYTARAG